MLLMFAAGVANLWWMAGLTALMVYEKTGAAGRRAVPVAGIVLLACAALVLAHPHWLPPILGGHQGSPPDRAQNAQNTGTSSTATIATGSRSGVVGTGQTTWRPWVRVPGTAS